MFVMQVCCRLYLALAHLQEVSQSLSLAKMTCYIFYSWNRRNSSTISTQQKPPYPFYSSLPFLSASTLLCSALLACICFPEDAVFSLLQQTEKFACTPLLTVLFLSQDHISSHCHYFLRFRSSAAERAQHTRGKHIS